MVDDFTADDFRHLHGLLTRADVREPVRRAALSNNINVIIAALRIAGGSDKAAVAMRLHAAYEARQNHVRTARAYRAAKEG